MTKTEHDADIATIARKHQLPEDAVATALDALRRGGGGMAQFSHPAFGGTAQWSRGGMSMIGDMFDSGKKAQFEAMMADLAKAVSDGAPTDNAPSRPPGAAPRSEGSRSGSNWWTGDFGAPSSSGSQNEMRYAFFPGSHRLVVDDGQTQTTYDTGDLTITGVSQQQGGSRSLSFRSQNGPVALDQLSIVP